MKGGRGMRRKGNEEKGKREECEGGGRRKGRRRKEEGEREGREGGDTDKLKPLQWGLRTSLLYLR